MSQTPDGNAISKENTATNQTNHLLSIVGTLQSTLDTMLPETLRNNVHEFNQHLNQQKANRLSIEKSRWGSGLNFMFETLKQYKDWNNRNPQFVQLKRDLMRFEDHISILKRRISESASQLELESGLRDAQLEGRVGTYKFIFLLTKIALDFSRPTVTMQLLKASNNSLSIYCDTFVLDVTLAGGQGFVEDATLLTIENEETKRYDDRDNDLLVVLRRFSCGDNGYFTEKLTRLLDRAELAAKYRKLSLEDTEYEVLTNFQEACLEQVNWKVKRVVDGLAVEFNDDKQCHSIPLATRQPPLKKAKHSHDTTGYPRASDVSQSDILGLTEDQEDELSDDEYETATRDNWIGIISFTECQGKVALQVSWKSPIRLSSTQGRELACAVLRAPGQPVITMDNPEAEQTFREFMQWVPASTSHPKDSNNPQSQDKKIVPHDVSICYIWPPNRNDSSQSTPATIDFDKEENSHGNSEVNTTSQSVPPMGLKFSFLAKEDSLKSIQIEKFVIPLENATSEVLGTVLRIVGQSIFFHSVLQSAFEYKQSYLGMRVSSEVSVETATRVNAKVDVPTPNHISIAIETEGETKKNLHADITLQENCVMSISMKERIVSNSDSLTDLIKVEQSVSNFNQIGDELEIASVKQLSSYCHSIPLLTYYAIQHSIKGGATNTSLSDVEDMTGTTNGSTNDVTNGITSMEEDLASNLAFGGEDMLLEDIDMF